MENKTRHLFITLTLSLAGILILLWLLNSPPARVRASPPSSIAGSTVTPDHSTYVAGGANVYVTTIYNASPDVEWLDQITITFPAGWTITAMQGDAEDSCYDTIGFSASGIGTNQGVFTDDNGGYGEIWGGCSWNAVFTVTVPGGTTSSQIVNWALSGDEEGGTPHDISGNFALTAGASLPAFEDIGTTLAQVRDGDVAWGDYDNDNDLDILLTGLYWLGSDWMPIAKIYRNDGGGVFTDINAGLTGVFASSVAWGDYNNDGRLDILLTGCAAYSSGCANQIAKIYRNDGGGVFTDINAGLTGAGYGSAAWGDYDNDGDLDILAAGCTWYDSGYCWPDPVRIYRNDNGVFTNINASLTDMSYGSIAWGDYDDDGDLDVLLTGCGGDGGHSNDCSDNLARIYRNDGGGVFTNIWAALTSVGYSSAAWGDYDDDGDLDIALMGKISSGWVYTAKVYRNDGGGTFSDISATLPGVRDGAVAWGDYDNDGDLDILLTGRNDLNYFAQVYQNDGVGVFTDIGAALQGVGGSSAAWGDYDNDGDLDILLTGFYVSGSAYEVAKVYRNNSSIANTVASAPGGLNAWGTGRTATLRWNAASDGQTPANGLSYNLRVGTTPGGMQTVAPMAATTTGYRKIPQLGNANHGLTATLKNLAFSTTYYWSVQAIDAAWAGSAFASEGSFTTPTPPDSVTINGPATGIINAAYVFTATVTPLTATQPITYVWQATGQLPVTHTGGLSDTATFTWAAPGTRTITVTAINAGDAISGTHHIVIGIPPSDVTITGPAEGVIQAGYSFSAAVHSLTTTTPVTYVWEASGKSAVTHTNGGLTDQITFDWSITGSQVVTVTANNGFGTVGDIHVISLTLSPPTGVIVSGPMGGVPQIGYLFVATVDPLTTTRPVTFTWEIAGQVPVMHVGELTDTATFAWPPEVSGPQVVTVTASNAAGAATGTRLIMINRPAADVHILVVDTAIDSNAPAYQACTIAANDCSLRGAISKANADTGNAYTIELPAGNYILTLSGAGEDSNASGDLDIKNSLTIIGGGADYTIINGNQLDRVLHIHVGAVVQMSDVKITGGRTANGGSGSYGGGTGGSGENGGGIYIASGTAVTLTNITVVNNTTGSGGAGGDGANCSDGNSANDGVGGLGGSGGGIYNGGTLALNRSTVISNTTGRGGTGGASGPSIKGGRGGVGGPGSGIYNAGTLALANSAVVNNTTAKGGNGRDGGDGGSGGPGGIYNGGTLTGNASVIQDNIAGDGGDGSTNNLGGTMIIGQGGQGGSGSGIYNSETLMLNNSIIANNTSGRRGNDILVGDWGGGSGSALYNTGPSLHLIHASVTRNIGGDGNGIYVTGGSTVVMTNTILVSHTTGIQINSGSTAKLESTLWGSGAWANGSDWGGAGTIITGTHNYWGDPAFVNPASGDYHIGATSTAIDKGGNVGVDTDIDNQPRPNPGTGLPDLGADEYWVCAAINEMSIAGSVIGKTNVPMTFIAVLTPSTPTPYILYTWWPEPAAGQGTTTVTYTFDASGDYLVYLTAQNCGGGRETARIISVETGQHYIYLPMVIKNP